MAGIIWFVVVIYIVIRCISASKKNQDQAKPNVPRKQSVAGGSRSGQMNRTQQQNRTGTWSGNGNMSRPAQNHRTNVGQTGRTSTQKSRSVQENSILQKAKANVSGTFEDDALQARGSADLNRVPLGNEIMKDKAEARHIHSEHETDHGAELKNQAGVDDFDTYHLIDEVNDLIVKGYSGNLEFERDFLAEATDMLNRMYG